MKHQKFLRFNICFGFLLLSTACVKQQPMIPMTSDYETMTVATSDRTLQTRYPATIKGTGNILVPVEKHDCIVIPKEATFELQDKVFVYKVIDGVAKSTPVSVFPLSNGKEYIVESGLTAGDMIVASGAGMLRDGVSIGIKEGGAKNEN